jgi:hypothetical protein
MDYIDIYCERLAPGLLAEPLNAFSNISFFVAAVAIWRLAYRQNKIPTGIWILIIFAIAIGIGSSLFHTFATQWAMVLDIVPILLFQIWYIWLYSRRVVGMVSVTSGVFLTGFFFASNFSRQFTDIFNGSLAYAPVFLILTGLGIYHYQYLKRDRWVLLAAAGVFSLSLFFRTLDSSICPYFSLGTHFLWHLLNGGLLYLSARGLILNWDKV